MTVSRGVNRSYVYFAPKQRLVIFEHHIDIEYCEWESIPVKTTWITEFFRILQDGGYIRSGGDLCSIALAQKRGKLNMISMVMSY